jgi:hypothetical protein
MEFYSWQTMFDEYRRANKHDPKLRKIDDTELALIEANNILSTKFRNPNSAWKRIIRLRCEYEWIKAGRPYYNVHPQMVRSLCKTNLEKIPANLIEIPDDLRAVVFRFAEPVETRYTDNSGFSVASTENPESSPIYCRSVLFSRVRVEESDWIKSEDLDRLSKMDQRLIGSDQLMMVIDEGFRLKTDTGDRTLCNTLILTALPGRTIPEAIQDTIDTLSSAESLVYLGMGERLANLFRIIISSGFLANSPEDMLVVPDVIAADRQKFSEAQTSGDQDTMKRLVDRARKRGKNGYNVGTSEMFVGEARSASSQRQDSEATGKELTHSHIRGGHPHAVRYGEGKSKIKIKWFRPTRVRPDLPFKAE